MSIVNYVFRQMEQNHCQSILKEMGVEEQRLLSDSDED
jgi:hypothetical protein